MAIKIETIEPVAYATKATAMRGVQRFKDKHGVTVQEATFVVDAGDDGKFPVAVYFKTDAPNATIEAAREAGFVVTVANPGSALNASSEASEPKAKRSRVRASEERATAAEAAQPTPLPEAVLAGESLPPEPDADKLMEQVDAQIERADSLVALADAALADTNVEAEPPVTVCPPPKALQEIADRRAKIEAAAEKRVRKGFDVGADDEPDERPRFLRSKDEDAQTADAEAAPAPQATAGPVSGVDQGLCATKAEAVERAVARYGNGDDSFVVKRCVATGEWFWGAFDERLLPVGERALLRARKAIAKGEKPKAEVKRERKAAASTEKREAKARGETRPDGLTVGTAAAKMVDAVLKPEGATYQELLDVTGWGECRPALVKACAKAGVDLRLDKSVKPSRYFGTRAA